MRTISRTKQFKRDYKREKAGRHGGVVDQALIDVVTILANDAVMPERARDHPLSGEWKDHRDCHVKPDLVLIYRKPNRRRCNWCVSARIASLASDPHSCGRSDRDA